MGATKFNSVSIQALYLSQRSNLKGHREKENAHDRWQKGEKNKQTNNIKVQMTMSSVQTTITSALQETEHQFIIETRDHKSVPPLLSPPLKGRM